MLSCYSALALLILIWGTTWAAVRIGLQGIPPLTGVALRFALAAAVLSVVALLARIPLAGDARMRRLWLINTSLSFCIPYGVVYWAQQWLPSGLAALLYATYPLFVAALAHFCLPAERLQAATAAGIALGFVGVAVIYSEDLAALGGPEVSRAAAVFLLSPAAAALNSVLIKRWGAGVSALALTAPPMVFTAVVMGGLALGLERGRPPVFDVTSVGALLYLGILGTAVSFAIYYWLLERLPATRLSLITYGVPIVAVVVGTQLLHERFTGRIAAGAGLVLAGVGLAVRPPAPDRRPAADIT